MEDLRRDPVVRAVAALWFVAPCCMLFWSAVPFPIVAWVMWGLFTLTHVSFTWDALRIARSPASPTETRRVWAGLVGTGSLFILGDGVRMVAMLAETPSLTGDGVPGQVVLVSLGVGVATVAFLRHPLGLDSAEARLRFTLDLGVMIAAAAAFSAYTVDWPDSPTSGQVAQAIVLGPGISALATLTVFKLVVARHRPFTVSAGTALLVAALVNAVLGGMGDSVLFSAYLPVSYLVSFLSSTLLPLGARLQWRSSIATSRPQPSRDRPYARSPYVAAVAANVLMVTTLVGQGLGAQSWTVVLATVTATAFVIARQLTALRETSRLSRQLEHIAFHDTLTGLANRRSFDRRLAELTATDDPTTSTPTQVPSIVLVDMDGFKQVNDTFGHGAGDALLAAVAARLRSCTRDDDDLVARLGGDEFAIILAAPPETVTDIAHRIVESLSEPFPLASGELRVGASVGVATGTEAGWSPDDLLRHADAAMYEAKRAGKGRVRLDAAMTRLSG